MKNKALFAVLIMGLLIMGFISGDCFALMKEIKLEELTDQADLIVKGTVKDIKSTWNPGETIYTNVTIQVEQTIKGVATPEISLRVPGGEVGKIGLAVSDAPTFKPGENVIVFLKGEKKDVFGLSQGKYTIKDKKVLENNLSVADFIQGIKALIKPVPILKQEVLE